MSVVNHPAVRLPGPNLLHHLVAQQSQDGQPAIEFLGTDGNLLSITYTELHRASDALARRISGLVVKRPEGARFIVPVLIPQSPELYIALLAILKAGGAFCPMNLDVPSERAKYILEDVAADLVITTPELASKVPQGNHSILIIDDGTCEENLPCQHLRQPRPEDLAYVMYTSGSTGTPKGVGVSHDAVTQSLLAHARHIPSFSRFLQFAAPTFDVSVFEIFFPLIRGKTLVACHRPLMLNDLPGVIRKMHVDACELTPSVAGSLLRKRDKAPNLRLLLTIGEMLTHPVIEEFGGSDERPSMLWAMYGPTEAAIHCTLQPAASHDSPVSNIGVPLDTVSAFVLRIPEEGVDGSRDIEVLPKGEIGELAVGGYQLADGYLNRPEQTTAAFINSPYGRLYRTGDKARMLPDGRLECLGRISEGQVKLRGQRMELGEVEHAALRVSACHGAVAVVIDAVLVLFCATDDPAEAVSAAVMKSCKQWLPGFMLPTDIVVVGAFPRLASGKVDRKALVFNYKSQTPRGSTSFDFKDELEKQIHTLTQEVVGVEIDPTEDLAKAGLDSLGAIKLASVLRKKGVDVGAIDILESRSVSGIATLLRSRATGPTSRPTPEAADAINLELQIVLANHSSLSKLTDRVEAVMPCTPLQAAMLAETAVNPRAYCNWIELAVVGGFSPESVRGWFQQLARSNEILRTGFVHYDGELLQVIFSTLDEASINICDEIRRDFELNIDSDLMLPFHVQIETREGHGVGAVVLQIHHALYDGWSLDLLLGDLAELAQGRKPAPRPQFRLITGHLHSQSFNEACNASREFWASSLRGYQPHALPVLRSEVVTSSTVASSSFTVNLRREIVNTAMQKIECAPQSVFQAAVVWLWGSVLGSEDVVIGGIQSGRTMPITGIENIIGPCITSVPLRVDTSVLRTIKDLILSVHMGNRSTLAHSLLPLAEIKSVAGIPPGQACYDVAFVYQESLHSKVWKTGPFAVVRQQDYLETKLLVEVEPASDRFEVRLTYHSDVFPEAQIKAMGGLLQVMIPFMLEHLNSEITSLRACFAQGQLSVFNPIPKTFEGVPDLAYSVEQAIKRFPDKDAVCFADHISDGMLSTTTITFAELGRMAENIAWRIHHLWPQDRGVVAIVMEKSIRLYAGILAILKTGNAYLPLLPSTPRSRIATILEQANVSLCLVDTATRANLEGGLSCAFLDIQGLDLGARVMEGIKCAPDPDRLAYVIYTSGSTGVPKGVCVTQRNILSNLEVLSRIYPVGENSKLLQSCSQAFDVSVFEIFFAWTQGMCLCSATNDTLFEDLERSIRKMKITHLSMTPTVASLVDPTKVPSVEFLVTAGEPMTEPVARKWAGKLYQGYGPSETTNICSVKRMLPGAVVQHLGWCFDNTSAFVMAMDSLDLLPIGCLGELCFGGDQVAQGYLGADELTATKFINHPQFGRIYRSGDLGRMLPDGSLVIVGRADEQVKIRGQRVELNEITEVIRQSQDGAECATLLLRGEDTGSSDQIISYFVPRQHKGTEFRVLNLGGPLAAEIRSLFRFVESWLPTYMIPSALIPVSALPITTSGKLDRTRLKQEYRNLSSDQLTSVSYGAGHDARDGEQWSAVEHRIAEILSATLGVDKHDIGRWTSLITLGLDSISAIQVSRQLHAKLGVRIPISVILQNPTVARLAKTLNGVVGDVASGEPLSGERRLIPEAVLESAKRRLEDLGTPFTKILPCTPLQEAMLAASTGRDQYVNRMLFRVNGDIEKLKAAWDAMICRHDILRTCFIATDDPMWPMLQVILREWETPWVTLNPEQQQQHGLDAMISQHADHLFPALDSTEPPVSFAIVSHAGHTYLSFICHHALYDGVAIEKLLHEVEQYVSGCLLPPPATSYDQFLSACRSLPKDTEMFWQTHFEGHTPKLTRDITTHLIEANSEDLRSQFDMALSEIQSRVRELGVSLLSLTQAAWTLVLGALFHSNDVCFGNVFNGRTLPIEGIDDFIAPCFNTVPVRMSIAGKSRNIDVMKAFQRLDAELLRYQFTPLRRIRSWAFHQHNSLIFDTILLLQQSPRPLDQNIWTMEKDDGEMDVPLVCEVIPDVTIDKMIVKVHVSSRQPLASAIPGLVFNLFLHALGRCLIFPGSHAALDNLPKHLADKLSFVEFSAPQTKDVRSQQTSSIETWTPTESAVRTVLSTVSSTELTQVRRHTSIYHLGLDSISAVQVARMLRKLGHQVLAADVINNPTCESLARFIDDQDTSSNAAEPRYDISGFRSQAVSEAVALGVPIHDAQNVLPCTPVQCAMMAQFLSSGRDYFNSIAFELDLDVGAEAVADAWRDVAEAYPILKTMIIPLEQGETPFAMIQCAQAAIDVHIEDADTFDLDVWRVQAMQAAIQAPHLRLWNVALVTGSEHTTMHLAIHHALYDAQSLGMILDALSAALKGQPITPRTLPEDAVVDILDTVRRNASDSAEFWKVQREKAVVNSFPIMTPLRQPSRHVLTKEARSSVPLSHLEGSVSKEGHTMQVVLQAAWVRTLSAYLGEESVVFGVVFAGRDTEATSNAVFPCITTLPVIARNNAFNWELLADMMHYTTALSRQHHQPLSRIQHLLGLSDVKLFDTLLVYQKFASTHPTQYPWKVTDENPNTDYPISLEIEPRNNHLEYRVTFFSDVLPEQQASLLLRQYDAMVQHLALRPEGVDADLCVSKPEIHAILPPQIPELPTEIEFLHQFVERQSVDTPTATALHFVDGFWENRPIGRTWTYQQLHDNGNRVAHLLRPHTETGAIVAVYFDKCPAAYFSILGILKAGCAFVALDPSAPRSRNEFILRDSGSSVLLTSPDRRDSLDLSACMPVISISEETLESLPTTAPILSRPLIPQDVCYCLYTSGTTGTPKGCLITHDNAVQCMLAFQHIFQGHWDCDSRWLQFASLHFDVSVLEQYWSWSVGITLVSAPRDLILEDLAGSIARLGITHIDLTPSLARLLHPDDVPSLCRGVFITGGEALKQEILDAWGSKGVIYNFYGPTEATIGVTVFPRVPTEGRASNIGQQFVNVGSYVLRPGTEQPVLRGGVGELCVSGRLVGKGYLNRDDLTAERFPILKQFGERVYRTGDLVRVLHDGCFDFLGRADDQVKLRGQRLEIGEINHTIRKGVPAVKDVATLVVRNSAQEKDLLVSFIVSGDGTSSKASRDSLSLVRAPEAAILCRLAKDACKQKLPGYMVPTYVLQLPAIPLSANNKAEVKKLRAFFASLDQEELLWLSSATTQTGMDLSPVARKIASAISTMQGVDILAITPGSSIYDLGIDSISVLRLSRALKKEGLHRATPMTILQHPVIGDLASVLESEASGPNASRVTAALQRILDCHRQHETLVLHDLGVTKEQVEYIAPCSPLQQGMLARSLTEDAYFNTFQLKLAPGLALEILEQAWRHVVDSLPILRTRFVSTADGHVQVATRRASVVWEVTSLDAEESVNDAISESRASWVARVRETASYTPEVLVIETPTNRFLILHIFHGLYDGNSFDLILDKLAHQYQVFSGEAAGTDFTAAPSFYDALPHGPLQDFSDSKDFWLKHLEGSSLVPDSPLNIGLPVTTARREIVFDRFETLRTNLGVTHQALLQAAWIIVLAGLSRSDPTIGIIFSGRNIALDGVENVVGPLFNTLPFHPRIVDDGRTTRASLIRQCHSFNVTVLPFQHTPLRDIQKWYSSGRPLFDTLFSFRREVESASRHDQLWTMVESEPNADYPLAFEATLDASGRLHLLLVARGRATTDLDHLLNAFEQALDDMAENPENGVEGLGFTKFPALHESPVDSPHDTNGVSVKGPTNGMVRNGRGKDEYGSFGWSEHAELIRREVSSLADVDPQSVTDTTPIFALGLDSIDVIKLSARLKRSGLNVKPSQLMKLQTIQSVLQHVASQEAQHPRENLYVDGGNGEHVRLLDSLQRHLAGRISDDDIVLPTTALQESMVIGMVESDFKLYFNHDIMELASSVDVAKLKQAWLAVIANSPILRTRFLRVEDPSIPCTYCQVISQRPSVHMADVSLDNEEELTKICEIATFRARKGVTQSDLLQLHFASVGNRHYLVLSIAHVLYDGWSLGLIHQQVRAAYWGRYEPPSLQFYLKNLEVILSVEGQAAHQFWSEMLRDAPPTILPANSVGLGQEPVLHRDELVSSIPISSISDFCRASVITLQTLSHACWAAFLAARTGSRDVTFGAVLSCRDTEELEDLVFPTMNTVAIRSLLNGSVRSWLRSMQDNATNIRAYQQFPLREAQKLANCDGPLFNTLFLVQRSVSSRGSQEPDVLMRSVGGTSAVEYPICVEIEVQGLALVWRIACDGAYASLSQTSRILLELDQLLQRIMDSADAEVAELCSFQQEFPGRISMQTNVRDDGAPHMTESMSAEDTGGWSPVEKAIRDVLAYVSGMPATSIRRSNNIYHLGLDSITALKALGLLRKQGLRIPYRDVVKGLSISEISRLSQNLSPLPEVPMDMVTKDESTNDVELSIQNSLPKIFKRAGIEPWDVETCLPASPMQIHMLSVWQNTNQQVFYATFSYTLPGDLELEAIVSAWTTLEVDLPILRSVFITTDTLKFPVCQLVLRPTALKRPETPKPGQTQWQRHRNGNLRQPYHCLCVTRDAERWVLRLKIHHALYDAVSLSTMMTRFAALCAGRPVEPLSSEFGAFDWATAQFSDSAREARKKVWTAYLDGVESQPPSNAGSSRKGTDENRVHVLKKGAINNVAKLQALCKDAGTSFQALFFAVYAKVLAATGGARNQSRDSVVFGIYLANRASNSEDRGTRFWPRLRLLPLRVLLKGQDAPEQLIGMAHEIQRDLHAVSTPENIDVGLWEIRDWTGVVVDSFVNFLSVPAGETEDTEGDIKLELATGSVGDPEDDLDVKEPLSESGWPNIGEISVRDAFPDQIDIEAALEDDSLTIGVFGSMGRLGNDGAVNLIDALVRELQGIV